MNNGGVVARLLAGTLLFIAPLAILAASFDCAKAQAPIERKICGEPKLSALDDAMAKAYQSALARSNDGTGRVQADQLAWLKSRTPDDGVTPKSTPDLEMLYGWRIDQLNEFPAFPEASAPVQGDTVEMKTVSRRYDFVVRVLKTCSVGADDCGAGQLLVRRKGQSALLQRIDLPKVYLWMDGGEQRANLVVRDFNFDGEDDIAIQNGNYGSQASPSYDIFLFDKSRQRFVFNEPMTTLVAETMGLFATDAATKRLQTTSRDGTVTYAIEHGRLVPVARHFESLTTDGRRMEIVDEELVNGSWKTHRRYKPAEP